MPNPLTTPPSAVKRSTSAVSTASVGSAVSGGTSVSASPDDAAGPGGVDKAALWNARALSDDAFNMVGKYLAAGKGGDDSAGAVGGKRKAPAAAPTLTQKRLAATATSMKGSMKTMAAFFGAAPAPAAPAAAAAGAGVVGAAAAITLDVDGAAGTTTTGQ